ncbi:Uridine nucleosidase [Cladobotryum mycophilum]|uniref:Uridine nucleosidase n=1 Tax=Cladobotryum mycophilum TaxID=491253 RepID=A0ABR0S9F0_9HYPO
MDRPTAAIAKDAAALWQPDSRPIPLWLDCDTGHDDAFAILVAAQCPAIRLLGISTVHGNAPLEHTTYNTRAVLKAIHREDVSVFAGAAKPFCRLPTYATDVHGKTGLYGAAHLPKPSSPSHCPITAVEKAYLTLSAQEPNTAFLVATGSLTNVALLFALHPDLADHIRGLAIMGGAVGNGFSSVSSEADPESVVGFGNTTPWAEFNVYCDPEAAQAVFSNPKLAEKTTLIPLDLTHQMLAMPDVIQHIRFGYDYSDDGGDANQGQTSTVRRLFDEIVSCFAKSYADLYGLSGPPLHDPLAVAVCFAPTIFDDNAGERFSVDIVTDGNHPNSLEECAAETSSQCGRTMVKLLPGGSAGVRIPRTLDVALTWRIIDLCLKNAENGSLVTI